MEADRKGDRGAHTILSFAGVHASIIPGCLGQLQHMTLGFEVCPILDPLHGTDIGVAAVHLAGECNWITWTDVPL